MKVLDIFRKFGLSIDWSVIRYGWEGPGDLIKQLNIGDVQEFADQILSDSPEADLKYVSTLSLSKDEQEIESLLSKLSPTIPEITKKKWHIVILEKTLNEAINYDGSYRDKAEVIYFYWPYSDYFSEIPFKDSPLDYYSKELFENLIEMHRKVIKEQLEIIKTE